MSRAEESAVPVAQAAPDELAEVVVKAREPRYVAPTRRDSIGRIWAPVYINERGPFRLVLDTGASRSGVTAIVAERLGIPLDASRPMMLRGVTGKARVPSIRVDSFIIGDLTVNPARLPILTDALGGADGVLGTEALDDKRIVIDFRHDHISIMRSRGERAAPGFMTLPFTFARGRLLTVPAVVGNIAVTAVIDTGGQATIANLALRDALRRHRKSSQPVLDQITGATADVQEGEALPTPPITFGPLVIRGAHVTYGDMYIFEHWRMTDEPAMLIGMDALGLMEILIIDYKRREIQLRMRS
jgi:hypothetical protein